MRCNNCGWDNPDTNTKCEKCNAPLSASKADSKLHGKKTFSPQSTAVGLAQDVFASQSTPVDYSLDDFTPIDTSAEFSLEIFTPESSAIDYSLDDFSLQPSAAGYDLEVLSFQPTAAGDDLEELTLLPPAAGDDVNTYTPKATVVGTTSDDFISNKRQCMNCSYPVRPDDTECPMCGHPSSIFKKEPEQEKHSNVQEYEKQSNVQELEKPVVKEVLKAGTFIQGADVHQEKAVQDRRKLIGLLISYSNSPNGDFYPLYEGKNFIGRSASSNVFIQGDSSISERHMSILYRVVDQKIKFRDEQSSNGTYVNGELMDDGDLKNFDKIRIGATQLLFMQIPLSMFE